MTGERPRPLKRKRGRSRGRLPIRGNAGGRVRRWQFARPVVAVRAVLILLLVQPVMAMFSRRRTRGLEWLDTVDMPVLFAANHLSVVDNPAVLLALPWRWRLRLATAAAEGVMRGRGRFQSFMAALISNGFFFSQTGSVRTSLELCGRLTDSAWSILYFPEGKRSDDGTLGPFRPGIGMLASRLGVPVVPVHLRGTDSVLAKGGNRPRRGSIEVRFGQPLLIAADADYDEATEAIREAVYSLSQEAAP